MSTVEKHVHHNDRERIGEWQAAVAGMSSLEVLGWAAGTFGPDVAFATSLGLEDQVLTDMIARLDPAIPMFTLDTGRLFTETYDLIERTQEKYGLPISVKFPDAREVMAMVEAHGINSFRQSVELRKRCCSVRKLHPLRKALAPLRAWVVGLRSAQSEARSGMDLVEWDASNGLVKISPLANWTDAQIESYINEHKVPSNPLHRLGFPSIGCACCTRAVREGEDFRAGRWWWESNSHKECGLHNRPHLRGAATGGTEKGGPTNG